MALETLRICVVIGGALAAASLPACSSDGGGKKQEAPVSDGGGNTTGSGGSSTGGGGAGGTGGGPGGSHSGGASSGGSATGGAAGADPYTCFARQASGDTDGGTGGGTAAAGADCCGGLGTCTAKADLSGDPGAASYAAEACDAGAELVCAPKSAAADAGPEPSCHATFGSLSVEGRCIPKCFVLGSPSAGQLTAGDCTGTDVVCAPCFVPGDGSATGACTRGGDQPAEPAKTFAECGAFQNGPKMGRCVATALVMAGGTDPTTLPQDTCGADELCAPTNKVVDPTACFGKCTQPLLGNAPGGCVPTYIVEFSPTGKGFSGTLGQQTCQPGETCAPCSSPTDSTPTGACAN